MKRFFDKTNFIPSEFAKNATRQNRFLIGLLVLFFLASSFTFFNALYGFVDAIGSIVSASADVAIYDLLRSMPLILSAFMSIWALLLCHASFRKVSEEKWHRSLVKDAICLIVFAGVNILYVIIGLATGKYLSIVEGAPSPWFPLDSLLYSLLFIALGVLVLLYEKKWAAKRPCYLPKRGEIVTKARGLYCTFMSFWLLFALYGFAGGLFSIFIYDFTHGYAFYGVMTVLCFLLSPAMLCVWEFYYNNLKEDKKKELLLPLALCGLTVAILFIALDMVALSMSLDAPSNAGFGMFPIAFAASVNIATLLQVFVPLIVAIVALIKGIRLRKK